MGVFSTLNITRSKAMRFVFAQMENVSDDDLGELMDVFLQPHLYNCTIVSNDDENNNDNVLKCYE